MCMVHALHTLDMHVLHTLTHIHLYVYCTCVCVSHGSPAHANTEITGLCKHTRVFVVMSEWWAPIVLYEADPSTDTMIVGNRMIFIDRYEWF